MSRGSDSPGLVHPGLIGCLPDQKMLETWNAREQALIDTNPTRVPPLANPPFAATAHCGTAKGDVKDKVAAEGARTVPPREHGGNCDIKDLSRGSKVYFPVYVKGGGLSMGDLHFSQGDGEITFCGAIEMAGWLHLKVDSSRAASPNTASRIRSSSRRRSCRPTTTISSSKASRSTSRASSTISTFTSPTGRLVSTPSNT